MSNIILKNGCLVDINVAVISCQSRVSHYQKYLAKNKSFKPTQMQQENGPQRKKLFGNYFGAF